MTLLHGSIYAIQAILAGLIWFVWCDTKIYFQLNLAEIAEYQYFTHVLFY